MTRQATTEMYSGSSHGNRRNPGRRRDLEGTRPHLGVHPIHHHFDHRVRILQHLEAFHLDRPAFGILGLRLVRNRVGVDSN